MPQQTTLTPAAIHLQRIADSFHTMLTDVVADAIMKEYQHAEPDDPSWHKFTPDDPDFPTLDVPNHDMVAVEALDTWGTGAFCQEPDHGQTSTNGFVPYNHIQLNKRLEDEARSTLRMAAAGYIPISETKSPQLWPNVWLNDKEQLSTMFLAADKTPFNHWPDAELVMYAMQNGMVHETIIPGRIALYNTF